MEKLEEKVPKFVEERGEKAVRAYQETEAFLNQPGIRRELIFALAVRLKKSYENCVTPIGISRRTYLPKD